MSDFYIHPSALVETDVVGSGSRIWAFAHVLKGAVIGCNCNIGDHCFVEGDVTVGDDVVIKNGVSIWAGVTLEDFVFVGPNAVFTNDLMPRAKVHHAENLKTLVRRGATIGANATLRCGAIVGSWAMIGAGSVVTHDVPDFALVYGVPARQRGWVCACGQRLELPVRGSGHARCRCGRTYTLEQAVLRADGPISPPSADQRRDRV